MISSPKNQPSNIFPAQGPSLTTFPAQGPSPQLQSSTEVGKQNCYHLQPTHPSNRATAPNLTKLPAKSIKYIWGNERERNTRSPIINIPYTVNYFGNLYSHILTNIYPFPQTPKFSKYIQLHSVKQPDRQCTNFENHSRWLMPLAGT